MKILFHPSFDSGYYQHYSSEPQAILGTKLIGTQGLLDHLTLHNGLSGRFPSDDERATLYLACVKECAPGSFIETSFKNDSLGVARCLLAWRDALIMAGWMPSAESLKSFPVSDENKSKLHLLAKIENLWNGKTKGDADRWYELLQRSKNQKLLEEDTTLECRCAKEQLPFVIQQVLENCDASFAQYPETVQIPDTLNVEIHHYNNLTDAYRHVAARFEDYRDSVIINRDNVSLNHALFAWQRPLLNARISDANPLPLQLFKLAMSVFSRPLNINNIVSYLQLPVGPVPRSLRASLAHVLTANSGFGEVDYNNLSPEETKHLKDNNVQTLWDQKIINFKEKSDDNHTPAEKEKRVKKAALLNHITDTSIIEGEPIPTATLLPYINSFSQWANNYANSEACTDEVLMSQLLTVASYFRQLANTLKDIENISYTELENHVRTIYQPIAMTQARAQVDSLKVVASYEQLADTPQNLLWLDCCGADTPADQFEFLSSAERSWLKSQEQVVIPDLATLLELNRKEMVSTIAKVTGKVTLVASDYFRNEKMTEHPLVAELKMQRDNKLKIVEGHTDFPRSEAKVVNHPTYKVQYIITELPRFTERSESFTSIDTLINYPFDYTVQYIAKFSKPSDNDLGVSNKFLGIVAHHVIQSLVDSVKNDPAQSRVQKMEELIENNYNAILENTIKVKGLPLLLRENKIRYENFKDQLKSSILTLISIMKQKKLTPIGCEQEYKKPLVGIGDFNASIDMELEDEGHNPVIFDFKWSFHKSYSEKIQNGTSLQLELYSRELENERGKTVAAVGYYLLPLCKLSTADYETLKDADSGKMIIEHITPPQDLNLFSLIQNSVKQRKQEIMDGTIEEGEELDLQDLPYAQAYLSGEIGQGQGKLLLVGKRANGFLTKDSSKVFSNKDENLFSGHHSEHENNIPLNETPTTYPLLKGRLK